MTPRTTTRLIIIICGLALMVANQRQINGFQHTAEIDRVSSGTEMPMSLAITSFALGPLRGVVVNALWWRAIRQQDAGEHFDALQLTHWIAQLQPTFASVWAFLGWNMSYNIAHDFADETDRWKWIDRAISLLRDDGLRFNPDNRIIRHELARIFFDRIGGSIDPGTEYFKNQWAFRMMRYFDEGTTAELERLAKAPESLEALKAIPDVQRYVGAGRANGIDVFDFETEPPTPAGVDVGVDPKGRAASARVIYDFHRRQRIETDLKLNIDRMLFIDSQYGPLDWRLHQAHAIYWSAEKTFDEFVATGVDYSQLVRQSMIQSFYAGRLFHDPIKDVITRTNNLEIIGRIHDYLEYLLENHYSYSIDMSHKRFLERAVAVLYSYNRSEDAFTLFEHYRDHYLKDKSMTYERFVVRSLEASLAPEVGQAGQSVVEVAIYQSFYWLNIGEYDRANGFLDLAKLMWKIHQQASTGEPGKLLPPFEDLVNLARTRFLEEGAIDGETLDARRQTAQDAKPKPLYLGTYDEPSGDVHDHRHQH